MLAEVQGAFSEGRFKVKACACSSARGSDLPAKLRPGESPCRAIDTPLPHVSPRHRLPTAFKNLMYTTQVLACQLAVLLLLHSLLLAGLLLAAISEAGTDDDLALWLYWQTPVTHAGVY
jgi:hypothetical protein